MLPLHAGGDLPPALLSMVAGHCASCAACDAERKALQQAMSPLSMLGAERREAEAAGSEAEKAYRLEGTKAGAGTGATKADPLGDNFWHAIRRDLRTEGLVQKPGEEAAPAAPSRARILHAAPVPGARAVWGRAAMASAAALLAAAIFLPGGALRPGERGGDPSGVARTAAPAGDSVASAKGTADAPALTEAEKQRRFVESVGRGRGRPGLSGGADAATVGGLPGQPKGWIEETRSFTEPSLEFGLERWRAEPLDGDEKDKDEKEKGSLSF